MSDRYYYKLESDQSFTVWDLTNESILATFYPVQGIVDGAFRNARKFTTLLNGLASAMG